MTGCNNKAKGLSCPKRSRTVRQNNEPTGSKKAMIRAISGRAIRSAIPACSSGKSLLYQQVTSPDVALIETAQYLKRSIGVFPPQILRGNECTRVDIGQVDDVDGNGAV